MEVSEGFGSRYAAGKECATLPQAKCIDPVESAARPQTAPAFAKDAAENINFLAIASLHKLL
ncbi:hypothetical protein MAE02_53940 [Microvirga aerophila]|uniref:Uncharacterized protein n=1 Tax=Microvirga aerophila TaxID=670291 RepID=A0A512C0F3_9HYPH|nr:hypothetical protein MAE02_53940 [Microvirga aerophila]